MQEAKYNKNVIRTKALINQQAGWSAAQTTLFLLALRFSTAVIMKSTTFRIATLNRR
jgi:hypothetical protein